MLLIKYYLVYKAINNMYVQFVPLMPKGLGVHSHSHNNQQIAYRSRDSLLYLEAIQVV